MGTTAQKLQKLVEGKQAIVDAVNSKANASLTINSKLSDVASAISNISGSGANTSDATAVADDILKGKTAYTANGKVEGTIETYNGESDQGAEKQQDLLQKKIDSSDAYGLFAHWRGNNLDEYINSLDFSKVTDMGYMFSNCKSLKSVPFFNTSNVTNMFYMFEYCYELTSIPQLDTSKATSTSNMFYRCEKLTSIPQLDTSNVVDMGYMFGYCSKLISIPQLDTSKATNVGYIFYSCIALTNVPQLDTSSATSMNYMFMNCPKLTSIPPVNTSKATNMSSMFRDCRVLTTIDITHYNISTTSNVSNFAANCTALKSLIIRSFGTNYTLNSNAFQNSGISNGTGYIYVPRSMVDRLKSATNWSTYSSQIRALEDYTVDGTTTGALDESKI